MGQAHCPDPHPLQLLQPHPLVRCVLVDGDEHRVLGRVGTGQQAENKLAVDLRHHLPR